MDNLIGKTLDGLYTIRELIGTGGMANVYKAVVTAPGGPVPEGTVVAVKVLRQELMHDADLVRRFKNESKAISLLNHPNIVKVYDVSVSENLQYIVMECVEGMTLREYLNERGGKITSRETVHFIGQILRALDHAHRNGVVHRDIKPQNIMLLDNGQLRMMDFGIARISRAENQIQNGRKAMGSVHYISPEQARGDETDPKSDLYSVGDMMYEMLSGKLPFDADDMVEVARKQIRDTPKPLAELAPEVPLGLVQITERAMAKLPVNRYSSATEMLEALDAYVRDPSITFDYQYVKEEVPEKAVNEPMAEKRTIRRPPEAQKTRTKAKKKKHGAFMPVLLGITAAFALACAALCWVILSGSSNIMSKTADIVLSDFSGMTQDEVNASEQVASGQVVVNWEEEYNNDYAAGYVYKQSPVAGRTVREGDRFGYDYALSTREATVRLSAEYRSDRLRADVALALGDAVVLRRGYYEKELFPGTQSLGRSRRMGFTPYTVKALVGWAFSPRSYLEASAAAGAAVPDAADLFYQPLYNNRTVDDPAAGRFYAAELNFTRTGERLSLRITAFAVATLDGIQSRRYYDDMAGVYSDMAVTGIGRMACGVEAAADLRLAYRWSLSLAASGGRYKYIRNPRVTVISDVDNSAVDTRAESHMGGCTLGAAPQLTACAELSYFGPRGWGFRASAGYAGLRYVEPVPLRRTARIARQGGITREMFDAFTHQERLGDAFTFDASLFKSFYFGRSRLTASLMLRNLLGDADTVYSGYESLRVRRIRSGDALYFAPHATRYTYAYPRSFYLTISYKF